MGDLRGKLLSIHGERTVDQGLEKIRGLLSELYGSDLGGRAYAYLAAALERHLDSLPPEAVRREADFDPQDPYAHLDGTIFAICYPDNIYDDFTPTLRTLEQALDLYFPHVRGIHILPERIMSHGDLWPQDLLDLLDPEAALDLVRHLQDRGVLDGRRSVTEALSDARAQLEGGGLVEWAADRPNSLLVAPEELSRRVVERLEAAFDSHFNDGGFSQKTRARVDPRFGTAEDIRRLSRSHAVMLDYVVNHLDIDNPLLEAFRRGEGDGSAFLIITPERYEQLKADRILERTFRPRPYPLFTGLRKYPRPAGSAAGAAASTRAAVAEMNRRFERSGLAPLEPRLTALLAIHFKVRNDQGLTAADRRIFSSFLAWLDETGVDRSALLADSQVQPGQQVFRGEAARGIAGLLRAAGVDEAYAPAFESCDDEVFGEKFFVYTTFSESQADINPTTEAGFRLIVDDLFHLLSGGGLAMMRMDAIKYLWKEIGKRNFDMEEGNRLIDVIRTVMRLAAPRVLPLDEINSPDPVVYAMAGDRGFAYLFGQVGAVPAAFNQGSLRPIRRFRRTMEDLRPGGLVLFVTLSTHDGRSVQGLGVDRTDGHVSIAIGRASCRERV